MTIGEKIFYFRTLADYSQEQLAEKLSISRQSVSKWEVDQSLPQIEKVLQICDLFGISADELLRDDIVVDKVPDKLPNVDINGKNKYFGTDGFRGEANVGLTSMHAYKIGRFLGWYYSSSFFGYTRSSYRPKIVIGKDTRRSSYMLEYSLVAGITASGADAYMLHVTTTPSVSYVTRIDEFDCGVMITASHNPFYDNGIKIINKNGEKLDDMTTALIEAYIDGNLSLLGIEGEDIPLAQRENIGCIIDYVAGRNRYVGYLITLAAKSYKKLRIGLDCANGASWMIAKAVFDALGAQTYVISAEPDGININRECGSTHVERLCDFVKQKKLDVGFAFDGDADRCIAVDENGSVIDGDAILYILARRLKNKGALENNTVVATVMSNSGVVKALEKIGINCVRTTVGDRFVYEAMQKNSYSLGGEPSGHIILKKYATTGDGILTAIMLAEEMCEEKTTLSSLAKPVVFFPQFEKSVRVKNKAAVMADPDVISKYNEINSIIGDKGRILLRESGTEPVVRVMVEAETRQLCEKYTYKLIDTVKEKGHCCE